MSKAHHSRIGRLVQKGLIDPPRWLVANVMFEGITGSEAYGCRDLGSGDIDLVGFAIPPKHVVFPHLAGHVPGFGKQPERFDQYQQHHVEDRESRTTYDLTIYGIVKYFDLTMGNNPNMLDSLFLPRRCVTKSTSIYEHVRDNRRLFLSTKSYHTFRGYANAQLAKIRQGTNRSNERRAESIEKYGYDVKFAYHLVRLMLECEQILTEGDLVLDRNGKTYQSIRRGEWTLERLEGWFDAKERSMEDLVTRAVVPTRCDENAIRRVLLECLEMHYGRLDDAIVNDRDGDLLNDLENLMKRYGR